MIAVAVVCVNPPALSSTSMYWIDPSVVKVTNMATMKPQSPMRFVTKAFFPADALYSSVNQNEIRK